jgi:LysR family glycine cleavage system transcriptional activator
MNNRLPPLTALRAFEAAARHLSFAKAAAELGVTPAALSFQVRSLEDHLGAPVFTRLNRRVELTQAGQDMLPSLTDGFDQIHSAWQAAQRALGHSGLTVTSGPAFMAGWLAPRMSKFISAHPELDLRLTASLRFLNFQQDGIDLAIRFGGTSDKGYFSERLFQDWATPMMSPEIAAQVKEPKDLLKFQFVEYGDNRGLNAYEKWDQWCEGAGVTRPSGKGPYFSGPESALSYSAHGNGVVLGRISLAEPYLTGGRLVAPLAQSIRRPLYYRLVCIEGTETKPSVMMFREWIKTEISALSEFEKEREFF